MTLKQNKNKKTIRKGSMDQYAESINLNSLLENAPGNSLIWNRFLTELIIQLNFDSSLLLVTDLIDRGNTHFLFSANISKEYQKQYEQELNRLDSFNYFICKNPNHVFFNHAIEKTYIEEVETNFTPFCGQKYRFGISIPCNHNHYLSLLVSRKKALNQGEVKFVSQVLQNMVPSLDQAIHAEQRHKINSQLLNFIGDHFDGYIIVDHKLNILFSDPLYISVIGQIDCIKISEKRFSMKNPAIEKRLISLIENNETTASIHSQCTSCKITLIPISCLNNLYQWECYKDGFVLAFTLDNENNPILDRLSEIYQLSRCEAVCALHFMKTPSIPDIATGTYRSQETVRNHIKHTMHKMDVHNQAELMKKLITLAAL